MGFLEKVLKSKRKGLGKTKTKSLAAALQEKKLAKQKSRRKPIHTL